MAKKKKPGAKGQVVFRFKPDTIKMEISPNFKVDTEEQRIALNVLGNFVWRVVSGEKETIDVIMKSVGQPADKLEKEV